MERDRTFKICTLSHGLFIIVTHYATLIGSYLICKPQGKPCLRFPARNTRPIQPTMYGVKQLRYRVLLAEVENYVCLINAAEDDHSNVSTMLINVQIWCCNQTLKKRFHLEVKPILANAVRAIQYQQQVNETSTCKKAETGDFSRDVASN